MRSILLSITGALLCTIAGVMFGLAVAGGVPGSFAGVASLLGALVGAALSVSAASLRPRALPADDVLGEAQGLDAASAPQGEATSALEGVSPEASERRASDVEEEQPSAEPAGVDAREQESATGEQHEAHQALLLEHEALKSERDALMKREQVKINFFANTCHDLRTPLASIKGNNELLIRGHFGLVNQSQLRSLETTQRNLDRLLLMLDRLLKLSREQRDVSMLPSSEQFDLVQLLNDILDLFNVPARDKEIDLKWRCYARVMPVRADRVQLHRILTNLLGNALKFTHKGGHIRVHLRWADPEEATRASMRQAATELRPKLLDAPEAESGRWLLLRVVDTGRGIPSQALESIFERWTTTEGHGLGLSITRRYVRHHGGLVEVDSQESRGTSFSIWMPIGLDEASASSLSVGAQQASRRGEERGGVAAPLARDAEPPESSSLSVGGHKLRPAPSGPSDMPRSPDSGSILPERQTGGITIRPFQVLEPGESIHAQQARLDKSALDFSSASVILVLDDDPDILDFFAMVLQSRGCEVIPVQSVEALRQAVANITPDAMLLDYYLEGQPCVEELTWLMEEPRLKSIPKVIVSGRDDEVVRQGAQSLDAREVLRKPCGVDDLLTTVERLTRPDTDADAP